MHLTVCFTRWQKSCTLEQGEKERREGEGCGAGCDKPSQFMLTMHLCLIPQGGEAESLTPSLVWPAITLGPKCDTSSLRWECMSSVQRNTQGANKDVSALKHN